MKFKLFNSNVSKFQHVITLLVSNYIKDNYNLSKEMEFTNFNYGGYKLEFELYDLVKPDIKIFLHMPLEAANILKQGRLEKPDQHEMDEDHLKNAEQTYIELSELYNWNRIECIKDNEVKSIEEIGEEVYDLVKDLI